jgi:hypothetical protein
MPAILKIGHMSFFFGSTSNAATVADMLHKATEVDRDYRDESGTYREIDENGYLHQIEITMTNQKKPAPAKLALPEKVPSNNEFHQIKR